MSDGRRKIGETGAGLDRVEKIVKDTEVVGMEVRFRSCILSNC